MSVVNKRNRNWEFICWLSDIAYLWNHVSFKLSYIVVFGLNNSPYGQKEIQMRVRIDDRNALRKPCKTLKKVKARSCEISVEASL